MSFQGLHAHSLPGFPSWVELVEEAVAQLCFQLAQFLLQYQVTGGINLFPAARALLSWSEVASPQVMSPSLHPGLVPSEVEEKASSSA